MVVAEISIKLIFLPKRKETSVPLLGKNFRTAPYFIMHARLINYAFYSLSLNTIDNSLGNWIYTSLIITYCTNKRGFFFTAFLSALFFPLSLSLSLSLSFSFSLSLSLSLSFHWRALPTISPSSKAPLSLLFLFLRYLQGSNSQFSIVFVRLVYPLYHCSTCASCRSRVTFKIIFLIPYSNSKN